MTRNATAASDLAARAEPRGIGTGRSRDPLAREVRLLGSLLGQVVVEQEGPEALELVEHVRRRAIALRRTGDDAGRARLADELAALDPAQQAALIRAFGLYFGLINIAERRHRARILARRARASRGAPIDGSVAQATATVERRLGRAGTRRLIADLEITPVLTAHPTEARRRTTLIALGRCARLLERFDDPRLTMAGDREIRRRLREEISILWRTAELRAVAPTPLDEVRTAMVFFDETLFTVVPRLYRALADATGGVQEGPWPPAFLRIGSWVGGDRDGHPAVTAEVTLATLRIQADHLLRGYEAVCQRLMQTVSVSVPDGQLDAALARRLEADRAELPATMRTLDRRFPHEPYRQRFGAIAERLRRTRASLTAVGPGGSQDGHTVAYPSVATFSDELSELAEALTRDRLERVVSGELADLRWQVATYGFHLASLEVRQHAGVHREALAALGDPMPIGEPLPSTPGVSPAEVVATFRAMAEIQRRYGEDACRRYVVSFTDGIDDVLAVLALADRAAADDPPAEATGGVAPGRAALDVVPLLESAGPLGRAGTLLEELLDHPTYAAHLAGRSGRQEVMLGYSDSNMESGFLAASWSLYRAQEALAATARRRGIELTIFHGRGGAIGRGGGPMEQAILAMAPGAVAGRLKLTEQGEVVAARYGDPVIALRELEQMVGATMLASTPERDADAAAAAAAGGPLMDDLAERARRAYRSLVWEEPAFAGFFGDATPIGEISSLRLGSRPASRRHAPGAERLTTIAGLRAIPWVFAWSQARIALPGWYGLGTALDDVLGRDGRAGRTALRRLYRSWPYVTSVLDAAELALARADMGIGREYAALSDDPDAPRLWQRIEREYDLAVASLLAVTGRDTLLQARPVLRRSIELRTPYVDPMSLLQVRLLRRLRTLPPGDPTADEVRRLVHLSINGVAAGILTTG